MNQLRELESLSVVCIVDNDCDTMSQGIDQDDIGFEYQSERTRHTDADQMCLAGHGLSLLLTATSTTTTSESDHPRTITHTLLLDAGPTPDLWIHNAEKLGIDYGSIEAVVLSHYHYDHSGGLRGAIPLIVEARAKQPQHSTVIMDLHSSEIVSRGRRSLLKSGDGNVGNDDRMIVVPHSPTNPSAEEIRSMGASVELHDEQHALLDDCFYVSGYIPRESNSYETGMSPTHVTLQKKDGQHHWEPDSVIPDERYLACLLRGRGLVIFSSCSHAGINNVCHDAIQKFNNNRRLPIIYGIVGGLHLGGEQVQNRIGPTVADLAKQHNPSIILGGHCTGWKAKVALANQFPKSFQPLAVGGTYNFHAKPPREPPLTPQSKEAPNA